MKPEPDKDCFGIFAPWLLIIGAVIYPLIPSLSGDTPETIQRRAMLWQVPIVLGVVFSVLAAIGKYRHRKLYARFQAGLCLRCGYDLRATPDHCPECGWKLEEGGNFDQSADNMNTKDR